MFRPSITLAFGLLAALMACTSAPSATLVAADAAADDAVVEDVPLRPDVAPDVPELDTAAPADLVVFDQPNVLFDGSNDASVPIDVVEVDTRVALDALADTPCAAGQTRCASACVDLERDPANCGACGTRCDALPGVRGDQVRCEGGRCVLSGACTADRADCDRDPSNGCEADLSASPNCGACGTACTGATPVCAMRAGDGGVARGCSNGCEPTAPTRCGMSCVDTEQSSMHCGACGNVCSGAQATMACRSGRCVVAACAPGYLDCDGDASNGCEVAGLIDPMHCGTCTRVCPAPTGGTATCAGGLCGQSCPVGTHLCGSACLADTSIASCGSRCTACPAPANGTATCDGTTCGFTCIAGFHRCGNACVSNTDPATCGGSCTPCTAPAFGTATCNGTACGFTCTAGYHRCGDACVSDLATANCGASCTPCTTPSNASATCDGTRCGFTCNAGYHACGNACASDRDPATCGGSCTPCPAPANGTATCTAGACGIACNTGFTVMGTVCAPLPARPLAPLSTSRVTSRRPTLRWLTPGGPGAAQVRLCRDRALTESCQILASATDTVAPGSDLPAGVWFWRVDRTVGGVSASSPVWQFVVKARSAPIDTSWGSVPDFNGDGLADLLVTRPHPNPVRFYQGRRTGFWTTPSDIIGDQFRNGVASVGDVNGDGFADAVVCDSYNGYLLPGSASGFGSPQRFQGPGSVDGWGFGCDSVTGLGDVTGDGYADVALGDGLIVTVHYGSREGLVGEPLRLDPPGDVGEFGSQVAGLDTNGDGLGDLVVGAWGGTSERRSGMYVYLGTRLGLRTIPISFVDTNGAAFARSLDDAGDFDGDGYGDLAVRYLGQIRLYRGSPTGPESTPALTFTRTETTGYAVGVCGGGDIDNDGFDDIAVTTEVPGDATWYPGRATGATRTPVVVTSEYGSVRCSILGDSNGDGYGDLAIGIPGLSGPGTVRVFLGDPSGPAVGLPTIRGPNNGYGFGEGIARARPRVAPAFVSSRMSRERS